VTTRILPDLRGSELGLESDASITESATPMSPGDSSGGLGSASYSIPDSKFDDAFLLGTDIEIRDTDYGDDAAGGWQGTINSVNPTNLATRFTADSIIQKLSAVRRAPNYFDTALPDLIQEYARICIPDIEVDDQVMDPIQVEGAYGWRDSVWNKIKELCAAYSVQASIRGGKIYLQPFGLDPIDVGLGLIQAPILTPNIDSQSVAVEIINQKITPAPGSTDVKHNLNASQTIENGQRIINVVKTNVAWESVTQPTFVNSLPYPFTGSQSSAVVYNETSGAPQAGAFSTAGGGLEIRLWTDYQDDDLVTDSTYGRDLTPFDLVLIYTGPKIGTKTGTTWTVGQESSGSSNSYAGMYVVGSGIITWPETYTINTGSTNTESRVGITVDNQFLANAAMVWEAGAFTAELYGGASVSFSFFIPKNTMPLEYGLVVGQRFLYKGEIYRATEVTYTATGVSVEARGYASITDIVNKYPTFADYYLAMGGRRFLDQSLRPLTIGDEIE